MAWGVVPDDEDSPRNNKFVPWPLLANPAKCFRCGEPLPFEDDGKGGWICADCGASSR